MRTDYCGLISRSHLDTDVDLCGWVHRRRDHGGVIFIDLRDREGIVQMSATGSSRPVRGGGKAAQCVRREWAGRVRLRTEGTVNPNL